MTKADYIRQVDAMALPDGLRQTLAGLPAQEKTRAHNVRPYGGQETRAATGRPYDGRGARAGLEPAPTKGMREMRPADRRGKDGPRRAAGTTRRISRWAPIAAALVLVVGLGMAAPAILRMFTTGGDLITPPPVTTGVPTPEGIISADIDVPDTVLDAAKAYVRERKVWRSEHSGVTEFVDGQWQEADTGPLPIFDNWRIESLDPCYEAQPIPKDVGQYTVSIYLLNYRLHTTTPERVILAGAAEVDEEGWYLDTYPDSTYMVFLHEGGQMRYVFTTMINDSSPGNALFESDILGELEQALGAEGTLSDEELTELLAGAFPGKKTPEDTLELLYSTADQGVTMGVLEYEGVDEDGLRRGFLILGAFDNATAQPSGQIQLFGGTPFESREMLPYSADKSETQDGYFLCVRQNTGATSSSVYYYPTLYHFDGREVKQVTSSPNADLPAGMEDMFDSAKNEDFWQQHKIIVAPGGFELFRRNPDWNRPDMEQQPLWVYDAYVPLAHEFPDPRVMAEARSYFAGYYGDDMAGSSYYPIQSCELVPDYGVAFYGEDSSAYRVMLEDHEGGFERYFVFDGNMELLNVATSEWASPWDSYEGRLSQISIKGVPFGGHFNEMDEAIRATLVDTGETEDLSFTRPDMATPWILKTYRSDLLEVVTATASEDVLKQRLAEGHTITRELYDRVSGVEYIHRVRPLDDTYATEGGLRVGDSIERAQKLFYVLPETGETSDNHGMDHLYITTENGVVTDIVSEASTRTMGEGIFY